MLDQIKQITTDALARLQAANSEEEIEAMQIAVLGRGGSLTEVLRTMGKLEKEDRAAVGQEANKAKKEIESAIEEKQQTLGKQLRANKLLRETLDITEPGKQKLPRGRIHPITQTYRIIRDALIGMGFITFDGPEVELDEYNFTLVNMPPDHSARDMQDTFYVNEKIVLRTHTTPCEVRALKTLTPPFRVVIPGRCFRVDEVDASHSPIFMQMEGLVVDKNITLADLKGTLEAFVHAVFGEDVKTRFRPSYFPFTEPSAELDISCTICGGKGCRLCKGTGWLEILGCGETNPHEIENCGLDPHVWSAFAFGLGVDRVASLKFGITDIRLQYENDARFLSQF